MFSLKICDRFTVFPLYNQSPDALFIIVISKLLSRPPPFMIFFCRNCWQRARNSLMATIWPDANNARKRKMKEVECPYVTTNAPFPSNPSPLLSPHPSTSLCLATQPSTCLRLDFNVPQRQVSPPPGTALDLNMRLPSTSSEDEYLNVPGSYPFKSYTSLLTRGDSDESLPPNVRELNDQIHQLIKYQGDQLSRNIVEQHKTTYKVLRYAAEEKASTKLKVKDSELHKAKSRIMKLQEKEVHLRSIIENMHSKILHLKQTKSNLREELRKAKMTGQRPDGGSNSIGQQQPPVGEQREVGESSNAHPDQVETAGVACKACGKRSASTVLMPCLHACICRQCDVHTTNCPMCHEIKRDSNQVHFA